MEVIPDHRVCTTNQSVCQDLWGGNMANGRGGGVGRRLVRFGAGLPAEEPPTGGCKGEAGAGGNLESKNVRMDG